MSHSQTRLVLASASPRRRELLSLLGIPFEVIPSAYIEPDPPDYPISVSDFVRELATAKAREVAARVSAEFVLGADTTVTVSEDDLGIPLAKPADFADAERMLRLLSGRAHSVYTAVALVENGGAECDTAVIRTRVWFREMSDAQIRAYVASGEPFDKAGAYGAQGRAAPFIAGFEGDFFNVVGLPICTVASMLERRGVEWWRAATPEQQ
jgi:septum formation protein